MLHHTFIQFSLLKLNTKGENKFFKKRLLYKETSFKMSKNILILPCTENKQNIHTKPQEQPQNPKQNSSRNGTIQMTVFKMSRGLHVTKMKQ